jgi:hypothetical protein
LVEGTVFIGTGNRRAVEVRADGCDPTRPAALRVLGSDAPGVVVEGELRPELVPQFPADRPSIEPAGPELVARLDAGAGWQDVPAVVEPPPPTSATTAGAPADQTATTGDDEVAAAPDDSGGGGGSSTAVVAVGVLVGVAGAAAVATAWRRRRS